MDPIFFERQFFLGPICVWKNQDYTYIESSASKAALIRQRDLTALNQFVVRRQDQRRIQITVDGNELFLESITPSEVQLSTNNSSVSRYSRQFESIFFNAEFLHLIPSVVSKDVTQSVHYLPVEFPIHFWKNDALSYLIFQSNLNQFYVFHHVGTSYDHITRYPVQSVQGDPRVYVQFDDQLIGFDPVSPTFSATQYYYLKNANVRIPFDITDIQVCSFVFPESIVPTINSGIIYSQGFDTPSACILARESFFNVPATTCLFDMGSARGIISVDHAAFPAKLRSQGHIYQQQFYSAQDAYSDNKVAFYVPGFFDYSKPFCFLIYLHGWGNRLTKVLAEDRLIEQINESRKNVILIVPQLSLNAQDSSGGNLDLPGGFADLMGDIIGQLSTILSIPESKLKFGKYILAAHSGGYQPMANILMQGGLPIYQAWLIDGLYWHRDRFLLWKIHHPKSRFVVVYTDQGGTLRESQELIRTLQGFSFNSFGVYHYDQLLQNELQPPRENIVLIDAGNRSHYLIVREGILAYFLKHFFVL